MGTKSQNSVTGESLGHPKDEYVQSIYNSLVLDKCKVEVSFERYSHLCRGRGGPGAVSDCHVLGISSFSHSEDIHYPLLRLFTRCLHALMNIVGCVHVYRPD